MYLYGSNLRLGMNSVNTAQRVTKLYYRDINSVSDSLNIHVYHRIADDISNQLIGIKDTSAIVT